MKLPHVAAFVACFACTAIFWPVSLIGPLWFYPLWPVVYTFILILKVL